MASSLSKHLPRLTIRNKLIVAFVGLSIIPVVLVGLYGLYSNVKTLRQIALENLTHDVSTVRERSGNFLLGIKGDLIALRNSSLISNLSSELESHPAGATKMIRERVEPELLAFAKTKGIYYQISLIGEQGNEIFRIECPDIIDSVGHCRVVPPAEFEGESNALYFLLARDLTKEQIAFAPAELRYQRDKQIPVVNFTVPLFTDTQRVGILRASVFAGNLFNVMQAQRTLGMNEKVVLVGSDGYYLYHSDLENHWDKLIATRGEENLFNHYPPAISHAILSDSEGIITEGVDEIIAYAPLFPQMAELWPGNGAQYDFTKSLVVFESIPTSNIMEPARRFGWTFLGLLVLFLGLAVLLGLLATHQLTSPIAEVSHGAEIISLGNYGHRLNVKTGDEIQRLAEQFNVMAAALESHEDQIAAHRIRLEELVVQRTKELVEEKGKLQAILDNVQSAFVLLDGKFRIQTASAAFSAITGFRLADVRGEDFRRICSGDTGFCRRPWAEAMHSAAKPEVHIDHLIDAIAGTERFLEHITIPVLNGAGIASMVAIITDVTQRKRLERQLIQSEKLMATGEMAAIIAHEFRNALTSIKMILQLQYELRTLSKDNRKSLGVALDSIDHMEGIVHELLNFARPSPLEFRTNQIETLIDECLSFARLRIHKQRIMLAKEIASGLPPIVVDAQRFKEAIINILLNAIQAIEENPKGVEDEKILTYAKRIILTKTIREYYTSGLKEYIEGGEHAEGDEIFLRKGAECLLIGISDTGPGINRETISRIFDPFFTTKSNGTGLGLPMVKRTINAHGGVVVVRSTRGKGTIFEIVLPMPAHSHPGSETIR